MLAFAEMLVPAAIEAGISAPSDIEDYDRNEYPHFAVFCSAQLGRAMRSPSEHWENAKVLAKVPDDKIRLITVEDLQKIGFSF